MLVDSHCHLQMLKLEKHHNDLGAMIEQAKSKGVEHILCVSTELESAQQVIEIAEQFNNVTASVGLHPSDKADAEPTVADIVSLAEHPKVIAVGETGLDYYYNDTDLDMMRERFRIHIRAAKELNKALIIHSRAAREDTIQIMQAEKASEVGGVMHCFTENWEMAQQAIALGFYISFSGIVTFKNAKEVAEVAQQVPLEKMLIETDAPYLAPVPYRGKQNEPQYLYYVAEKVAEIKNRSFDEVADQTTKNFMDCFKLTTLDF